MPLGLTQNFYPTTRHLTALKGASRSGELASLPWDIWLSQIPPLPKGVRNRGNTLISAYNK